MSQGLKEKIDTAIWIGKTLFDRQKVSGSSANLSFLHEGAIYITTSGSCFGNLKMENFAVVFLSDGHTLPESPKPSKELPLHRILYQKKRGVEAVLHTHSFYAALWSCLDHENETDILPAYTPYLRMKLGTVGLIPYAPPGSSALFSAFEKRVLLSDGYLLANHGPVVGGKDLLDAFYMQEELEESARTAWELRDWKANRIS